MFSQRDLFRLIIPLVIETLLSMTIGFVGTVMVAAAGQEAVSAVSLVDNINALILVFVAAIATGGAIVIAQYLGKGTVKDAREAAKQLLYVTVIISLVLVAVAIVGNRGLLALVFGEIEPVVMEYAQTYFLITAISYPFLAIQNAVSAVFRAMGISKTPMYVTLMMSVINIVICAILIYGFQMGVAGAAIAAASSRIIAAVVILILIRNRSNVIYLSGLLRFRLNISTIKSIMRVGIPSGLDSGMFQLGRLLTQSLIATFGTVSIAANAVNGQILNIIFIPGNAMQMAVITIVGQCIGAGNHNQASSYTKKLILYGYAATAVLCAGAFLLKEQILPIFNLDAEALALTITVLSISCLIVALIHPLSFIPANALRAAGDVKYTMIVSIVSMWAVRIAMSYIIENILHLGLMSVWCAMYADWFMRAVFFSGRFISGKWKTKRVV